MKTIEVTQNAKHDGRRYTRGVQDVDDNVAAALIDSGAAVPYVAPDHYGRAAFQSRRSVESRRSGKARPAAPVTAPTQTTKEVK